MHLYKTNPPKGKADDGPVMQRKKKWDFLYSAKQKLSVSVRISVLTYIVEKSNDFRPRTWVVDMLTVSQDVRYWEVLAL